jgi:hypothetical protein
VAPKIALTPLTHSTSGQLWYKALRDAGYSFGPLFQKHLEVEALVGVRQSRSLVSLSEPPSEFPLSIYPMHPACIDGCLQSVAPSLWRGDRSNVNAVLIPAIIDSLILTSRTSQSETGISVTSSEYGGAGRLEDTKNWMSNASVYDPNTGSLLLQISGLRYHKLDIRESPHAAHTYTRVAWQPDITYLSQDQLLKLTSEEPFNNSCSGESHILTKANWVIDMKAHKKPNLKVMEVNQRPNDSSSIWLGGSQFNKSSRAAWRQYCFASIDATALIKAQEKYEARRNTLFSLLDITKPPHDFAPNETDFDLVIVKLVSVL